MLMQMPGPGDIVIYWPGPRAFSVVQKLWGAGGGGEGGLVTGQIDTCINSCTRMLNFVYAFAMKKLREDSGRLQLSIQLLQPFSCSTRKTSGGHPPHSPISVN